MLSLEICAILIAAALISLLFVSAWDLFEIRKKLEKIANIQEEQTIALRDLTAEISKIAKSIEEKNNED